MRIGFTPGDLNGVGLEVLLKALNSYPVTDFEPVIYCNHRLLVKYIQTLNFEFVKLDTNLKSDTSSIFINGKNIKIVNVESDATISFGTVDAEIGTHAGNALNLALQAWKLNDIDALVTLPISKKALNLGGFNFAGHTELLAQATDSEPLMILLIEEGEKIMRVALATTHIPISKVSQSIKKELIIKKLNILNSSLKNDFGIPEPRIVVLGLNPHSGEEGTIGKEEIEVLTPAINECKNLGINLTYPIPADGFFARYNPLEQDAIFAIYHDQGLIPLKMYSGQTGVNFTAGLPIVRTSPDHGTAYNIASEGIADFSSTKSAIEFAKKVFTNRIFF